MPRQPKAVSATPDMRRLLVHYVRSKSGSTTIRDLLADPVIGPFVPELTLNEISGGVLVPRNGATLRSSKHAAAVATKRGRNGAADTRSAEGRRVYDEEVLAAIKSTRGPVAAEQVIKSVGGSGLQFRAATQRLLAARKIKRSGKARGTRYAAA